MPSPEILARFAADVSDIIRATALRAATEALGGHIAQEREDVATDAAKPRRRARKRSEGWPKRRPSSGRGSRPRRPRRPQS